MGTDAKRQTLILGGGATPDPASEPAAAPVAPRFAMPPPPHIRRSILCERAPTEEPPARRSGSGVPDPDALDAGWDSMRPASHAPAAQHPPVVVRSASNVPVSRSPASPPPVARSHVSSRPVSRATTSSVPISVSRPPASPPPVSRQRLSAPVSVKPPVPWAVSEGPHAAYVPRAASEGPPPVPSYTPTPVSLRPAVSSRPPQPLFLAASLPPPPSSKRLFAPPVEEISSSDLIEEDEDRPSDRVTVPNGLAPKKLIELAGDDDDDRETDRSLATTRPPPPSMDPHRPSLQELAVALHAPPSPRLELPDPDEACTPSSLPPFSIDVRPPLTSMPGQTAQSVPVPKMSREWIAIFAVSHVAVAASVLFWVYATRREPPPRPREPRIALEDRNVIESAAGSVTENVTPAEGCRLQDLSRVIASRAELGPALDAAALESGFGVGVVSKSHEATGIRLDATTLRTAETVKVRSLWPVTRVAVDKGEDEEDRLEVRVDGNDTKTLSPTLKITAQRGGVFMTDGDGDRHLLWALPGYVPKTETVRAVGRADGSAVVAVRRQGVMWIGVTGQGPIVPMHREKKTLGTPALTTVQSGGGVVAWAERDSGPFSVVLAAVDVDGKRATVGEPIEIAEGISPALATLPNGELLLTYSDGPAGAHRVVAQRLGADLSRRGDLLVLSSSGLNAGQPAIAVDAEGRAIVAYLAIENGRAEVHATSLVCR